MSEHVRFDLGFVGGGSTNGTADVVEWERLEGALQSGAEVVLRLEVQDGVLLVRPSQIAYARRAARERTVGF